MPDITNPNLDNGREHRVGADLYDWNYNNTYNIDTVVKDIKTFIDQLYTHSMYSQEVLCDVTRMCGPMKNFVRNVNVNRKLGIGYYSYTLEIPMKNIPCFKTLAIKRAQPRIYTIYDSCSMTDLFKSRVMFFANGQFFPGIRFYADTTRFTLIIDVDTDWDNTDPENPNQDIIRLNTLKSLINSDAMWSIVLLPFSNTMHFNGYYTDLLDGDRLDISNATYVKMDSDIKYVDKNIWFVSVASPYEKAITKSTFASAEVENGKMYLKLPHTFAENIRDKNVLLNYNVMAVPNACGTADLNLARAFQIQFMPEKHLQNPIPPENILVFETDGDGAFVSYIHNVTIKQYYPNIYVIEGVDPTKFIKVLWMYNTRDTTEFTNPLDLYMKYNTNYPTEAINGRLPLIVKNYIPMVNTYIEKSYIDYFIRATRRNEFTYKFEYLKDLVRDDTTRLEKIYTDMVTNTAYNWHSSPRYHLDLAEWGNYESRIRRDSSQEVKMSAVTYFNTDCIYFVIEHEDERVYPVAVWADGIRCAKTWQFTEKYRTFVYISTEYITPKSHLEFEILKVRDKKSTIIEMTMPSLHNSIQLPAEFDDISPQNIMISRRMETSDSTEDGSIQYIWKIAPDYEMYWLMFGHTKYIDGVPEGYNNEGEDQIDDTDVTTPDGSLIVLNKEEDEVLNLTKKGEWDGGEYDYLMENGFENYITAPNDILPDIYTDYINVRTLGFYGHERRRFYEYVSTGKDDKPFYITPITDYFANQVVKIQNTDIYWTKTFTVTKENRQFKIRNYRDEPIMDRWRIFVDGKLLIPGEDYHVDASVKNGFYLGNIVTFVLIKDFEGDSTEVFLEYMPYKYGYLYTVRNVNDPYMQIRDGVMTRPFSLVYYDMYIDGEKVNPNEVEVITPSKIHILRELNNSKVSFYERRHDPDIYDNEKTMQKSLIDYISEEDKSFRNYLLGK